MQFHVRHEKSRNLLGRGIAPIVRVAKPVMQKSTGTNHTPVISAKKSMQYPPNGGFPNSAAQITMVHAVDTVCLLL